MDNALIRGQNFLDSSPPYSKKGPTDENVGISYLIVIVKFVFFSKFQTPPSPILEKSRSSPILLIVNLYQLKQFSISPYVWQPVSCYLAQ